ASVLQPRTRPPQTRRSCSSPGAPGSPPLADEGGTIPAHRVDDGDEAAATRTEITVRPTRCVLQSSAFRRAVCYLPANPASRSRSSASRAAGNARRYPYSAT
ncbi:e724096d-86d0-44d0-9f59-e3e4d85d3d88, partial [Thermothielavioides terrestris]